MCKYVEIGKVKNKLKLKYVKICMRSLQKNIYETESKIFCRKIDVALRKMAPITMLFN